MTTFTQPSLLDGVALPGEDWRPVPGYEATYMVSSYGRVWSHPRPTTPGGILRTNPNSSGYPRVQLVQGGRQRQRTVHALVTEAFLGPRPAGQEVRHLDGDSLNARLENLAYGTHGENMLDAVRHGTHPTASRTHCPRGHSYEVGNLVTAPSLGGRRYCLTCAREHGRRANAKYRKRTGSCALCGASVSLSNMARHQRHHHPSRPGASSPARPVA